MFKNYLATENDLQTIEEALSFVWNPKLDFVFRKKELIASTVAVSYDSKHIYLWVPLHGKPGQYRLRKIPHHISIPDRYQMGWVAGVWSKIENQLPSEIKTASRFAVPRIGGGLLEPFITLQKKKGLDHNPYTTRESYLATIVHEFGHIYFHQKFSWWFASKDENLEYLQRAHNLYSGKKDGPSGKINIPNYRERLILLSEIFAFCTDYCASSIFWKSHKTDIDAANINEITKLIADEKKRNLLTENSVLDPDPSAHSAACVIGKILVNSVPKSWPQKILSANYIYLP